MLEELDHVMGHWDTPAVSEGSRRNLTPSADLNVDMFPKGVDAVKDRDFDSAVCG